MTFEEAKDRIRRILTYSHPIASWELEDIMDALDITPCDISTCKIAKALWGNKGNIPDIDISRVKNGTPLEAQLNRCDSCIHSEEQDGLNCYECVKGMSDKFEVQPTGMRDATEEERKSVKDYVDSVSKPTGVNFNELLRDCGTCKHNTAIDCGQYPCNECNRKTHPLYEPKITQPTDAVSKHILVNLEDIIRIYSDKKKTNALNGDDDAFIEAIRECQKFQPCEDIVSRSETLNIFRANSYPIVHGRNNHDKGMTLTGIEQVMNEMPSGQTQLCGDAVSREAVLELAKKGILVSNDNYKCVVNAIKSLPPVTPQRPKGNWIYIGNSEVTGLKICECSVCKKRTYGSSKYCPNCNAEMVDSQESEDTE